MTASVHTKYINGNLVRWDTHRKRLSDAVGGDAFSYSEDWVAASIASNAPAGWTSTLVGSSTVTHPDGSGGTLLLTSGATDDDGVNMQLAGESFQFTTSQVTYFGVRLQASTASAIDILAGLCITDTTLVASSPTDGIWFDKLAGATGVNLRVRKNATETASTSLATFAAATYTIWEFYWDGAVLEAFIDGTSVATPALTNLPDDELLTPSICLRAGDANARTLTVDWVRAISIGR